MLTVVKVGGGLAGAAGDEALRRLCATLGDVGRRHPLLVVPGGAGFADAVRDADRRFGLSPLSAHRMAILGMEQFGWVLSEIIPDAVRCSQLAEVPEHAGRRTAVLLPAGVSLDELPASWEVTSDAIAAWVAVQMGAGRLVLVKALDGLFAEGEPLARLTAAELAKLRPSGVDAYLPAVLEHARFETWVIGGHAPARIAELLERGTTLGTRIGPARLLPWRHG